MRDLVNKTFVLVENDSGHVAGATTMVFGAEAKPLTATYVGPNVVHGHVIVSSTSSGNLMLYHALTTDDELVAGRAAITFHKKEGQAPEMHLQWQWITGDLSTGRSVWSQLNS